MLNVDLALKNREANAAFSAALAEFQKAAPCGTVIAEARRAASYGFSWFCRPSEPGFFEVRLCHAGGSSVSADGKSITASLAGLLGHPLAQDIAVLAAAQAVEPELEKAPVGEVQCPAEALPASTPSPAQAAAESLAAATSGAVVKEPSTYAPDPEEAERARLAAPLTDDQKAACIDMIKVLAADARRSFTIAFRDAFKVPREARAITPLIAEVRHMEFCDRWSIEAGGGIAP